MQTRKVEHGLVGPTRYGEEENPTVVCTKTSSPLFARRVSNAKAQHHETFTSCGPTVSADHYGSLVSSLHS